MYFQFKAMLRLLLWHTATLSQSTLASPFMFSVVVYQVLHDVGSCYARYRDHREHPVVSGLSFLVGPSLKKSKLCKQILDSM